MKTLRLAPVLALTALFLYPMGCLLLLGLRAATQAPPWADPFFWHTLAFTYSQAFFSAILSGLIGMTGAVLYSEQRFRGRRALARLSLVCFSLPVILVVLSLNGLWGNRFLGWPAILLAHAFFNFPIYLRSVGAALEEQDRSAEMAALSLGAGRWSCFFQVTVPKILPAVRSAFFLSFLYCSASFLVVLMLGGGPRFTTLEVAIFQAIKMELDLALAARLALVQIAISLLVYLLFLRAPALMAEEPQARNWVPLYYFRSRGTGLIVRWLYGALLFLIAGAPLVALMGSGLAGLSSMEWGEAGRATLTSLGLACAVALVSTLLALGLAYGERHAGSCWQRELFPFLGALPLSVSSMVLTLALILAYPAFRTSWRGSFAGIVLVQSLLALPLVVRPLRDGFFRLPPALDLAARSLGAGPWRSLIEVELPLLRNALRLAVLFAVAFSMGEVGSVLLFLSVDRNTLPLWIFRLMGQYRFEQAYPVGCLLVAIMAAAYWLMGDEGR